MGFNLGAFAAGAVKEAGDTLERQHKETKDRIQKGTDFAYQSGLPFYKQQKDKLRKLTQLSSEVQNLGLNADQVEMVMGQSEASINEFLTSSRAEQARTKGVFKPASQVVVGEGGVTSRWQDVQMGVIDPSQISRGTPPPASSSILSKLMGGDTTTGFTKDYDAMVAQSTSTLEGATGATLQQMQAAAQGAYTYGDATKGSITLMDSSSSIQQESNEMSVESQRINLKFANQTQAGKLEGFYLQLHSAENANERADLQLEIDRIMQPAREAAAAFSVEADVPVLELQNKIAEWERNSLRNYYGANPEEGLHIATVSLENMLRSDNPDPEKIRLLKDTISLQNASIGEALARQGAAQKLSFGHFNLSYSSMLERRLSQAFPDPNKRGWTYDGSGTLHLDPSKKMSKEVAEGAREAAKYDFLKMARKVVLNGGGVTNHLIGFTASLGIEKDQLELPLFPTKASKIKADTNYLVMDKANSIFYERTGKEYFDAIDEREAAAAQEQEDNLTAEKASTITANSSFTTTSMSSEALDKLAGDYAELAKGRTKPSVVRDPDDFTDEYRLHENEQDYYRRMAASNLRSVPLSQQEQLADMYKKLRYENDAMTDKEFREGLDLLRAHGTTFSQLKFAETNIKALQSS
jgi:hypothetical protein